jgi:DNA-directed RNA polymerase subunit RPC12/RpoP
MSDIYFKCEACGNHLVVDEARRGMPIECPDCHAPVAVPTMLRVHQCPQCGQRLMIGPEMKGALLHCSSCEEAVRAPGLSSDPGAGETSVVIVCPQCHANVNVSEEISNRPAPCPNCGARVYFRDTLRPNEGQNAGPPKPKEHDEFRFRRKSQ